MEREVGGGIGMGNTCKDMAVSFQCMTKFTTKKKVKKNKILGVSLKTKKERDPMMEHWDAPKLRHGMGRRIQQDMEHLLMR